jgi:hypothetical protein
MTKRLLLFVPLLLVNFVVFAQTNSTTEMADRMRSDGKIYVVVAVIVTIFIGIILYLIRLDRKISRLEKSKL